MSFICESCEAPAPNNERPHRVVIAGREREYPARILKKKRARPEDAAPTHHMTRERPRMDPGGKGWEIARELLVCGGCAPGIVAYKPPELAQPVVEP